MQYRLFLYGNGRAAKGLRARLAQAKAEIPQTENAFLLQKDRLDGADSVSRYLQSYAAAAAYTDGNICYYDDGKKLYAAMQTAVDGATKFILVEYFIIKQGKLWTDFLKR